MITGRTSLGERTKDNVALCRQVAYVVELKFTTDDRVGAWSRTQGGPVTRSSQPLQAGWKVEALR